jgi:aldehyde:ferredoxin oxidoreductase
MRAKIGKEVPVGGNGGRILRINLTNETVSTEPLGIDRVGKFIGGRGLASHRLLKEIDPAVDGLAPENKLIIATGPLTGISPPVGGRYALVTKSPLDKTLFCSHSGGSWGARLNSAGFDMVIIEGAAKRPSHIVIAHGKGEIRDASSLWGKGVSESAKALEALYPRGIKALSIGPAGENRSLLSCVINEEGRTAGRGGIGAVLGSKNLKALVVLSGSALSGITTSARDVSGGMNPCLRCPVPCLSRSRGDSGRDSGAERAFRERCGVEDPARLGEAVRLCNELGLDAIAAGEIIASALEYHGRGCLRDENPHGIPLEYGNGEALVRWISAIGRRKGLGEILAGGPDRLAEYCGLSEPGEKGKDALPRRGRGQGKFFPDVAGLTHDSLTAEGRARWVKAYQDLSAVIDSAGICLLSAFTMNAGDYAAMINGAAGTHLTKDDIMKSGERIWNLEHLFHLKTGFVPTMADMVRPLSGGPAFPLSELYEAYCELRGWDRDGSPGRETWEDMEL